MSGSPSLPQSPMGPAPSLSGLIRLGRQAVKFWFSGLVIDVGADQGDQTEHDDN